MRSHACESGVEADGGGGGKATFYRVIIDIPSFNLIFSVSLQYLNAVLVGPVIHRQLRLYRFIFHLINDCPFSQLTILLSLFVFGSSAQHHQVSGPQTKRKCCSRGSGSPSRHRHVWCRRITMRVHFHCDACVRYRFLVRFGYSKAHNRNLRCRTKRGLEGKGGGGLWGQSQRASDAKKYWWQQQQIYWVRLCTWKTRTHRLGWQKPQKHPQKNDRRENMLARARMCCDVQQIIMSYQWWSITVQSICHCLYLLYETSWMKNTIFPIFVICVGIACLCVVTHWKTT